MLLEEPDVLGGSDGCCPPSDASKILGFSEPDVFGFAAMDAGSMGCF